MRVPEGRMIYRLKSLCLRIVHAITDNSLGVNLKHTARLTNDSWGAVQMEVTFRNMNDSNFIYFIYIWKFDSHSILKISPYKTMNMSKIPSRTEQWVSDRLSFTFKMSFSPTVTHCSVCYQQSRDHQLSILWPVVPCVIVGEVVKRCSLGMMWEKA